MGLTKLRDYPQGTPIAELVSGESAPHSREGDTSGSVRSTSKQELVMKSTLTFSTVVAAALLALSPLSYGQAGGAAGGSSGGPQTGSEAGVQPSGPITPSGGTAAGGMGSSQKSMSSSRTTTEADMTPSQKAANKDKREDSVKGAGTPSGVTPSDGKSPNLPRDQMGRTTDKRSSSMNSAPMGDTSTMPGATTAGPMNPGNDPTADKGPVMGEGNGPSGVAPAPHTSKNKMPKQ
jgi:hypothetical protein